MNNGGNEWLWFRAGTVRVSARANSRACGTQTESAVGEAGAGMRSIYDVSRRRGARRRVVRKHGRRAALRLMAAGAFGSLLPGSTSLIASRNADAQGSSTFTAPPSPLSGKRKMISLVVLSNKYVSLTADSLSRQLDELHPGKFWPRDQQANFVIDGLGPGQFLIKSTIPGAAGMFMLLSVPGTYTEFSSFARSIVEPTLRRTAEAQHCWLSVDLIGKITTDADAYRFIGAVLAKLAPADAAVLVRPDDDSTILFNDEVRRRLAEVQAVSHVFDGQTK
jgi:hypothetical protein